MIENVLKFPDSKHEISAVLNLFWGFLCAALLSLMAVDACYHPQPPATPPRQPNTESCQLWQVTEHRRVSGA